MLSNTAPYVAPVGRVAYVRSSNLVLSFITQQWWYQQLNHEEQSILMKQKKKNKHIVIKKTQHVSNKGTIRVNCWLQVIFTINVFSFQWFFVTSIMINLSMNQILTSVQMPQKVTTIVTVWSFINTTHILRSQLLNFYCY